MRPSSVGRISRTVSFALLVLEEPSGALRCVMSCKTNARSVIWGNVWPEAVNLFHRRGDWSCAGALHLTMLALFYASATDTHNGGQAALPSVG